MLAWQALYSLGCLPKTLSVYSFCLKINILCYTYFILWVAGAEFRCPTWWEYCYEGTAKVCCLRAALWVDIMVTC